MIRLFVSTETNFNHNKWILNETLSCYVTETTDGIFDLDLEYLLNDKKGLNKYLIRGNIIKCPISTTDSRWEQLFTIRTRKVNTKDNKVTIYAQAKARRDLDLNMVLGLEVPAGKTRKEACQMILDSCIEKQGYYIGNLDTNTNTSINMGLDSDTGNVINYLDISGVSPRNAFLGSSDEEKTIYNAWGGEIVYNNFEINMVDERGRDHDFEIRSGKNLEELEQDIDDTDTENFATAVLPCSSDDVYLPNSEIIYSPNAAIVGKIFKKIVFDDVSLVDDTQEALDAVYAQLRSRVQRKFDDGLDKLKINNTVNFTKLGDTEEYKDFNMLEKCEIGNNITIKYYDTHDCDKKVYIEAVGRVLKIKFNVLTNKIEEVEIGDRKKSSIITTISNTFSTTSTLKDKINTNSKNIKAAVKESKDYTNTIKAELEVNDESIIAKVEDYNGKITTQLGVMSGQIQARVTSDTFNSEIDILDGKIESKVEKNQFGSYIEQNVSSVVETIKDVTGSYTCTFNSNGLTVQNGGLIVKDDNGNVVLQFKDGIVWAKDLDMRSGNATDKGSIFYNTLANMEEVSFQNLKVVSAVIPEDTYISNFGGTLKKYIEHVVSNM